MSILQKQINSDWVRTNWEQGICDDWVANYPNTLFLKMTSPMCWKHQLNVEYRLPHESEVEKSSKRFTQGRNDTNLGRLVQANLLQVEPNLGRYYHERLMDHI